MTKTTGNLLQGQFTSAAMGVYLAVYENRDWDACFNYLDGNKGVYNNPFQGMRAEKREEWF